MLLPNIFANQTTHFFGKLQQPTSSPPQTSPFLLQNKLKIASQDPPASQLHLWRDSIAGEQQLQTTTYFSSLIFFDEPTSSELTKPPNKTPIEQSPNHLHSSSSPTKDPNPSLCFSSQTHHLLSHFLVRCYQWSSKLSHEPANELEAYATNNNRTHSGVAPSLVNNKHHHEVTTPSFGDPFNFAFLYLSMSIFQLSIAITLW